MAKDTTNMMAGKRHQTQLISFANLFLSYKRHIRSSLRKREKLFGFFEYLPSLAYEAVPTTDQFGMR
jgi:hypothetical protein